MVPLISKQNLVNLMVSSALDISSKCLTYDF
jgi:hypothetical protein